jgi:hypothetical protein
MTRGSDGSTDTRAIGGANAGGKVPEVQAADGHPERSGRHRINGPQR